MSQNHQGAQEWSCHFCCCPQGLFADRNFLGAEILLCFSVLCGIFACFLLSPVWAASISWNIPPSLGCPRLMFPFLISGQCYLAKYFWPPPHCIPATPQENGIHLFTLSPEKWFSHGLFFHPQAGWNRSVKPSSSQPSLGSCKQQRYIFAGSPKQISVRISKQIPAEISAAPQLPCLDVEQSLLLWQFSGVFLFFLKGWDWMNPKITCPCHSLEERRLLGDLIGDFGTWRSHNKYGFSLYFHIFRY